MIEIAYLADADIPAVTLAVWATAVALVSPPREAIALALLALAGLLRPEAWLLSAAYFIWIGRGRSRRALVPLAALATAGPLLWALSDLAATGDALWSLHHTRTDTDLLGRDTGAAAAVEQLPRHLNFLLGAQVLVVGVLGVVAGLIAASRRTWGLVAVIVLTGGAFLMLALAGLSLQPRYLANLAAAIVVCAGIGGLGWLVLGRDDGWRGRWRAAGFAGVALLVAGLPFDAAELGDARDRVVDDGRLLEQLARGDARATLRDCGPVSVPTIRPIPYLALWADTEPSRFAESGAAPPRPARSSRRRKRVSPGPAAAGKASRRGCCRQSRPATPRSRGTRVGSCSRPAEPTED